MQHSYPKRRKYPPSRLPYHQNGPSHMRTYNPPIHHNANPRRFHPHENNKGRPRSFEPIDCHMQNGETTGSSSFYGNPPTYHQRTKNEKQLSHCETYWASRQQLHDPPPNSPTFQLTKDDPPYSLDSPKQPYWADTVGYKPNENSMRLTLVREKRPTRQTKEPFWLEDFEHCEVQSPRSGSQRSVKFVQPPVVQRKLHHPGASKNCKLSYRFPNQEPKNLEKCFKPLKRKHEETTATGTITGCDEVKKTLESTESITSSNIPILSTDNVKLVSPQQSAETASEDNVEEQQSEHKGVREETNFGEICSKESKDDPLAPVLEAEKSKCNVEKSEGNLDDSGSLSDAESEVFDDIFLKTIKKELDNISEDENCSTIGSDDCDTSRTEGSISPTFDSTLLRYLDDTTRTKIENRELSSLATISARTDDNNESDATIEYPEEYNACLDRGLSCDELTRDAKEIINAIDIIEEPGSEPLHSESDQQRVDSDENKTNASPVAVMHVGEDGSVETKDAVVQEGDVVVSKGSETESKQSLTPPSVLECADTNSSIPILDKMLDGKLTRHISTSCETANSTGIEVETSGDIEETERSHCESDKLATDSEVKDKSFDAVIFQNNNAVVARTLETCAESDMDVDDAIEFIRKNVKRTIGKRRKLSETEISETSETEQVTSNNVSNEELKQTITEYSSSFETSNSSFEDTVSFENHNSPFVPLCEGLLPSVEHELQKKEDKVNNNGKEHDECRCWSNKHTSTENEYIAFNDGLSTISHTTESVENTYKTLHSAVVASKMEDSNDLNQSCVINEDTSLTSTDSMKVSKPLGCKTLLAKEQPALVSTCLPLSKAIELVQEYPQTYKVPVSEKLTNEKTKPCGKSDSEVKTCIIDASIVDVVNPVQPVEESSIKDPLLAKHSTSQVREAPGLGKEIMAPEATAEPNLDEENCKQMVTQDMNRIKDSAMEDSEICNTFGLEKERQNLSANCNMVVLRDTATTIQEVDTSETLDSEKEMTLSASNEVSPKTDDLDIRQTSEVTRGFELKDAIMESSRATDSQNQLQNDVQDDELSKSPGVQLEVDKSGDVKEIGRNITRINIATGLKSDLQVSNQRLDSVKRENVELPSEELRINDEERGKPSFNTTSAMTSDTNENFIEESQVESQGTGLGPDSVLADGSEKEINDDPNSCLSNGAFIKDENKEMADTVELSDLATTASPAETPQVTKNHTMAEKEGHSVSGVIDTPPIIAMQAAEAETKADVEKKENLQSESSLCLSSKSSSQLAELKVPKEQRSDDFTGLGGPGHEDNASNRTKEDSLAHEPMEYFNNKLEHDLLFTNEFKDLTLRNKRNLGQGKKQKDTEVKEATAVVCQYLQSHQSCSFSHLLLDILTKTVHVPGKVEHIKAKDLIKDLPITQLPFHDGFMKDSDCSLTELEKSSAQNLITKASQLSDNEQDISSLESSDVEMTVPEMQGELRNDPELPSTGLNSVRVGKDTSLTQTKANGRQICYNVFTSLEQPGQKSDPEIDKVSTQSTFSEIHKLTDNLVSTHEGDISQTSGQEHKIESSPCQSLVQKSSLSNSEEKAVDNCNAFCEESAEISNNKKELSENKDQEADLSKNNKDIPLNGTYLSKVCMGVFKNNCEVSSNNKALLVNNVVSVISKGKVKTRRRGRLPKQARQIPDVQDDVFDKKVKRRSPRQRKLKCDEVFDLLCGSNLSSRELPYDPNMFKASSGKGLARRESFVNLETEFRAGGKEILELDPEQVIDVLAISEDDDEFFLQLDISSEEGSIVSELTQRTTPSVGSSSLPVKPCNAKSTTVTAPKITKECCPSDSIPHRMESLIPVATDTSRTNRTSSQSVPNRTPRRGRPRNRDEHFRKKRYGNDSKVGCIDIPTLVGSFNQKKINKLTVKKSPLQIYGQCSEALNVSTSSEGCASVAASKECELSASTSSEVYSRLVSNKGDLSASTSGTIHTGLGGPKASAVSIPTNCSAPDLAPNSADACGSTPTSQLTPNIQNVSRQTSSSTEKVCSSACTLNIQDSSSLSQNNESPDVSSGESLKVTLVSETDPLTGKTNWTTNYGKPTEAMKEESGYGLRPSKTRKTRKPSPVLNGQSGAKRRRMSVTDLRRPETHSPPSLRNLAKGTLEEYIRRVEKDRRAQQKHPKKGLLAIDMHDHVSKSTTQGREGDYLKLGDTEVMYEIVSRAYHESFSMLKRCRSSPRSLYLAAKQGNVLQVLVSAAGCNVNATIPQEKHKTAMHAAAAAGHLQVLRLLHLVGANLSCLDTKLQTPLFDAVENQHAEIVKFLIRQDVNLNLKDSQGMTVLHVAAQKSNLEIINLLMNTRKLDVNEQDNGGWTALMWTAEGMRMDVAQCLLKWGADVNILDSEQNTCLHWAALAGDTKIMDLLLKSNVNLNARNIFGATALHISARERKLPNIKTLAKYRPNLEIENADGEKAIDLVPHNSKCYHQLRKIEMLTSIAEPTLKERLISRDISRGQEKRPIPCINSVDDEDLPEDFVYVSNTLESQSQGFDRSMVGCNCSDGCAKEKHCECAQLSARKRFWYDESGRINSEIFDEDRPLVYECNMKCKCWSNCRQRVVQRGITAGLQLYKTHNKGWAVRTQALIPKGTFVCEYVGEILTDSDADKREDDCYLFDLDVKGQSTLLCLDAKFYGNITRFINHSCDPNILPVRVFTDHQFKSCPRIAFFAAKDIKPYEEVCSNYGEKFWKVKKSEFPCVCNTSKCEYSANKK